MLSFVPKQQSSFVDEYKQISVLIHRFTTKVSHKLARMDKPVEKLLKYEIYAKGLDVSIQELYASYEAAVFYREKVQGTSLEDMDEEEKMHYAKYVYFDKNGFVRVFSLLDKLGTFINELLNARTEKVKPHYSFFTVLRVLRQRNIHEQLTFPLNELKESCRPSTQRLRNRRNTEIHYMNSEMRDDLIQRTRQYGDELRLENLDEQLHDLSVGLHMTMQAIKLTFQYADELSLFD